MAARTAAGSGTTAPGTVARAAPAPGVAGSWRDEPSTRSGTGTEPLTDPGPPETGADALTGPEAAGMPDTDADALTVPGRAVP
ncbi:hypothetical protein [Paractinoplanes rishiriensis]|uniref:Uncharacterized protein n=1 Tax=Paractinoplanes rishiriensis TaxID=1050105 RepID=A0A919K7U1_9ACTN|nr:hypothetical protein [Actinoplanes rishiriensis]GIE98186.1 hypothetical protein Ari01nite_56510 [Actinoplanes rishiriensis]